MFALTIFLGALLAPDISATDLPYPNASDVFSCRFEEKDDRNYDGWPDGWRRRHGQGYPGYVKMAIESVQTPVGKTAFVIHANGSSAEIETRPFPVDTLHAYFVEAWVKTEGLRHDNVRVRFDFVDAEGKPVQSFSTLPERSDGKWRRLRVGPVDVQDKKATSAVLYFELLSTPPGDLKGKALLAEVTLMRTPRLELRFDQPEHVFFEGKPVAVNASVSGLPIRNTQIEFTLEDPISQRVFRGKEKLRLPTNGMNPNGEKVSSRAGISGPDDAWQVGKARWELPTREVGFYKLSAVLSGRKGFEQRARTTLAIIRPTPVPTAGRFGWTLPGEAGPLPLTALQRLVLKSGVRFVKIPIWFSKEARFHEMGPLLDFSEYLMTSGVETVGMFSNPPTEIRKRLKGTGTTTAASVFCSEPDIWYPSVENTFLYFGTRADYWQLGTDDSIEFCAVRDLDKRLGKVKKRISDFAKHAKLGIAWNWLMQLPSDSAEMPLDFVSLSTTPPLADDTLTNMLAQVKPENPPEAPQRWVALEPITEAAYSARTRAADLMLRMFAAHRGGASRIFLSKPFGSGTGLFNDDGTPSILYQPWRTTAILLAGTSELESLALSPHVQNFLLCSPEKAVLVAWSEHPEETSVLLGNNLVRVDAWGRHEAVEKQGERQVLETDEVPAFFLGIDPRLARMGHSFVLDKKHVPSIPEKTFHAGFQFTNTLSPIAVGKIELKGPPGWKLRGESHSFTLAENAKFARKFAFSLPVEAIGGTEYLTAVVTLTAPFQAKFEIRRPITVGEGEPRFLLCGVLNDAGTLDVFQFTCNDSARPVRYECQLFAPGRRRLTAEVACKPFECVKTVYHLEDGRALAGQPLFVTARTKRDPQVHMRRLVVGE